MFTVVYISSAVKLFSDSELTELLAKSRSNNETKGITGMLLYKDGNFMQLLEGPKDHVLTLLKVIERDPRHTGVIALLRKEESAREFEDWSMGFRRLDASTTKEVPGYSDFLDVPLTDERFAKDRTMLMTLLLSFRRTVR